MKLSRIRLLAGTATAALALAIGAPLAASAASASATQASAATAANARAAAEKPAATATGTFTNAAGPGTFNGTFTPGKFSVVNGVLEATGVLKGKLTSANGKNVGNVNRTVTMNVDTPKAAGSTSAAPAAAPAATTTCSILNLTLGPLNLNLLGLVVTLNQVHLTITAVPGAGALLGNLLCAVANLLNGGGLLSTISADLNAILALL